jgi:stage V sporulation protein G
MEITEVKVFPVSEEKLKAFVSVVIDDCFMVNDIKIIQGRENRFISMPSRRKKNGDFKDVAHPLNNETRRMMEARILAEYDRVTSGREVEPDEPQRQRRSERPEAVDEAEPESSEVAPAGKQDEGAEAGSMEEVAEKHLSDSFWST